MEKMESLVDRIQVFTHSSIRIDLGCIVYVDPFQIRDEPHDADYVLITHDHYDHFSPEDLAKVMKPGTKMVVPERMKEDAEELLPEGGKIYTVTPGMLKDMGGWIIETVPAYNILKPYHHKKSGWVGYNIHFDDRKIYIAGDTDLTKESQKVFCSVAMVPIGGTYTMDAKKAAELVNILRPEVAIPIHYGRTVGSERDVEVFESHVAEGIKVIRKKQY